MTSMSIAGKTVDAWEKEIPQLKDILSLKEIFWTNSAKLPFEEASKLVPYTKENINDAEARLNRFAAYLRIDFPETEVSKGIIESPLSSIPSMKEYLETVYHSSIPGTFLLKRDDTLPIAGTIKARGAIYEVLKHAETLALEHGLLKSWNEDYSLFATEAFKTFFSNYKIAVGTTGNLGISVGTVGAMLGFDVTVHMSVEAKQWKKDLLRFRGVTVIEHESDFTNAVKKGREQSDLDPMSYYVDDEHSIELFLGYTVAANRLQKQLEQENILVDENHPLFVYLPCGIGGSPGGISFGLKQIYGDNVHCFFAEPTHVPSMTMGLMTGKLDQVSVKDFGLDGLTVADGLAVPRTSKLVANIMKHFFSGSYTIDDFETNRLLSALIDKEKIYLEPAALAGVPGALRLCRSEEGKSYLEKHDLTDKMDQATHIAWATGGSMVPKDDMDQFYEVGLQSHAIATPR